RTAKDYKYVSNNLDNRGLNDPNSYTVYCSHEHFRSIRCTGLRQYLDQMTKVAEARERLAKEEALQAKIEAGKALLARRRAKEEAAARRLAQREEAKSLKVSSIVAQRRRKWELRLNNSETLETRGSWEHRRDTGGSEFYHCTDEFVPEPFSWDPPAGWDDYTEASGAGTGAGSGGNIDEEAGEDGGAVVPVMESHDPTDTSGSLVPGGILPGSESLGLPGEPSTSPHAVAKLTEKERLAMAIERLAENEDLLKALAWRLGIPKSDIRPQGREPPLARGEAIDESEEEENLGERELLSDDDASDSDRERGDALDMPGPLPQDHADLRRIRVAERKRRLKIQEGIGYKQAPQPSVPGLDLDGAGVLPSSVDAEHHIRGMGWRNLARGKLPEKFVERITKSRTQGAQPGTVNTPPKPRPTGTVEPPLASHSDGGFHPPPPEAMFIRDIVEEHARVLQEAERRMNVEGMLGDDSSLDIAQMVAAGPQEYTSLERQLIAAGEMGGRKDEMKLEEAQAKAVIATKTGNLEDLESLLYDDLSPDTKDSNGNTLLLLAAQQGNKRILKFLLRKGATMNHQNLDGNTVLHFCTSLGRHDLLEYLKSKGADDSLLNGQGLTCYEGLHADTVNNI
ncbi:unnamed protein product, partial [Discosporangium mesarthrocarpum]